MSDDKRPEQDTEKSWPPVEAQGQQDRVIHEYDGIEEYDNDLPRWWLYTLYGAVVFACVYWLGYHTFKSADLPDAAYEHQLAAERAKEAERIKSQGVVTPAALVLLSKDDATVKKGKEVFTQNCVACHRADAGGNIGPNLTDDTWIHGGKPDEIYKTVTEGVAAKGMPTWGPQLGQERVESVVAYVLTLRNTNVAGGKAPQGDIVVK